MDTSRITDLLAPFLEGPLISTQLDQISTYIDLLIRWNSRVNLTAIRSPEEIVTRHFGESLFAARQLFPFGAQIQVEKTEERNLAESVPARGRLVDVGSGAGFPGLPIKIWSPQTRVTLIESNHKKVVFLREVIRALTLTDIDVYSGRAEEFPPASAATITLRAVERFDQILPTAIGLLASSSCLALLISETQLPPAQAIAPTLQWLPKIPIPLSARRIVAIAKS
jgi:16S rRNA (guanine527-N7)-methyltransferase